MVTIDRAALRRLAERACENEFGVVEISAHEFGEAARNAIVPLLDALGPRPLVRLPGTPTRDSIAKQLSAAESGGFDADGAHMMLGKYVVDVPWLLAALDSVERERDEAVATARRRIFARATKLRADRDRYAAALRDILHVAARGLDEEEWVIRSQEIARRALTPETKT